MKKWFANSSSRSTALTIGSLAVVFVGAVLVPGLQFATQLGNSTAGLKFVGEQRRNADNIRAALGAAQDRLMARGYVQASIDELKSGLTAFDAGVQTMFKADRSSWIGKPAASAVFAQEDLAARAAVIKNAWTPYRTALLPVVEFQGLPYRDSESEGTQMTTSGQALSKSVASALRVSHQLAPTVDAEFAAVSAQLEASGARAAMQLRAVMLLGVAIAAAFIVLLSLLSTARRKQEGLVREARQQTEDILRTVKEGLFLLDHNLQIGAAHSTALTVLFQREKIAGISFEELLRDIVPERTLVTAMKFVKVLWAERTKENLVKSINPLGEVEVQFERKSGGQEKRYLEFDFHRVRVDGKIKQVLVSVSDVSARVALASELKDSQEKAQAQLDTLLGILHVDPNQLASFLDDSDAAMKMVNSVLKEPARAESAFRKKLDTIFRQVHGVKGEASALGLSSIESRAHAFEDELKALKEKTDLSGNDFLPLVVKLDDLFTHMQSIRDLVERLSRLRVSVRDVAAPAGNAREAGEITQSTLGVAAALEQLTEAVTRDTGKEAATQCVGFDGIPEEYRRIIKDISIQVVRNAIVHGIELPIARIAAGKPERGTVRLEFQSLGQSGYKLTMEDDGQGLSTEKIRDTALKKGFISPEQAATLDARQVLALLFRAGFSTAEQTTKDAGRGVGMNLVAELVQQAGGKVGVATTVGRFTRFTVLLPAQQRNQTRAA
jgi:HPt (histidine-containing phosphotransfer) domain-containing protein/PAS domain-containing protein